MIAIEIREPGGPEVLVPVERPVPVPCPEEILIKVSAAGVNRPDVMQREGRYPPPLGTSDIPGLEIAGVVSRVGREVGRWRVGDRVVALVPGGGYAEYCVVHETNALTMPEGLTPEEAAGLCETTFTVWHNVFQRGRLAAGERFLVHGGTSGIGTTAIQLAKAFGAWVATTVGSDAKCQKARELGADLAINYHTGDFVVALIQSSHLIDVTLDMIGGDYLKRNIDVCNEDARIVQIATQRGAVTEIDLWQLLAKRITLTGSTLRNRPIPFKAALAQTVEQNVWPLIAQGRFRPVIDRVLPLADAAEAHRRLESSEHIGKIILSVS